MSDSRQSVRWTEAVVLCAIFLDLFGFGMLVPDVQFRAEQLGLPGWAIGATLTITFVVQFLISPWWGRASDRVGRKPILLACGLFSACGLFTYGFAKVALVIMVSRFLSGLGGANVSIAQAYLADLSTSEGRTGAMGRLGAAVSAGLIAGAAALSLPVFRHVNPGLVAGPLSLTGVITLLALPNVKVAEKSSSKAPLFDFSLLKEFPAVRMLATIAVIAWLSLATLEGTFGRLIERTLNLHQAAFGQIFAFEAAVGLVVQGVLLTWLSKRFRETLLLRVAYAGQGFGLALMPWAPSFGALLAASCLYAVGSGVANGTVNGLCSRLAPPERQGELFGLLLGARSVGFVLGPMIGGAIFDWQPASPYLLAGGTCLLAALLVKIPSENAHDSLA